MNSDKLTENKTFFQSELFYKDYINKMPAWLSEESKKEIAIFDEIIKRKTISSQLVKGDFLDVACGTCRIFKEIPESSQYNRYAADIFDKNDLPLSFQEWMEFNKIEYHQVQIKDNRLSLADLGKFDIITCLGLDYLLERDNCKFYMDSLKVMLKPDGLLIWQTNRKDTMNGLGLRMLDKKLSYEMKPLSFYNNHTSVYYTSISRIYTYGRKI